MLTSSFVLGFHGCDRRIGEAILSGRDHVAVSENVYDWLGHGAYFWENSPQRALSWAEFLKKHPPEPSKKVNDPFVVGAIIHLGNCLDLTDANSLEIIRTGFEEFRRTALQAGVDLPKNEAAHNRDADLVKRHLDCAVVNFVHLLRKQQNLEPFDTVRGVFIEGSELYPGAKIMAKTHLQVCVRDPRKSIKGYFRPLPDSE